MFNPSGAITCNDDEDTTIDGEDDEKSDNETHCKRVVQTYVGRVTISIFY